MSALSNLEMSSFGLNVSSLKRPFMDEGYTHFRCCIFTLNICN